MKDCTALILHVLCALVLPGRASEVETVLRTREANCSCGLVNNSRGRIVGGTETGRNAYPFMVSLETSGRHFCGGSILTSHHVLTAAHCTSGLRPNQITVNVGAHNLGQRSEGSLRVGRVVEHPDYEEDGVFNDIALILTTAPIRFTATVSPVCLPSTQVQLVGQSLRALGWGNTVNGGRPSRTLQEVDLRVVSYATCFRAWHGSGQPARPVQGQNLCTYEFRKDTCQGDSGGPLVWLDPTTNRYIQAALVSYGGACGGHLPSVNTDVSHYRNWINSQITSSNLGAAACTAEGRVQSPAPTQPTTPATQQNPFFTTQNSLFPFFSPSFFFPNQLQGLLG